MAHCNKFANDRCTKACEVCKVTGRRSDGLPNGMTAEDYFGEDEK